MAILLNGKCLADELEKKLKFRVDNVSKKLGYKPKLATILVGNNLSSITYIKMKTKAVSRVGLDFLSINLPEDCNTQQVIYQIEKLNNDNRVCGILLQHPTPSHIDEQSCFDTIIATKDVDGVNSASFGAMSLGRPAFKPATPLGIITLLKHYKIELSGKNAVVVGRSQILGKPIAALLLNENCTVTICHSKTKNLAKVVKTADIVVGAIGKPKFIRAKWLKKGAVIIDAGYNQGNVGDIEYENAIKKLHAYTPVPGGVGPMTIYSLIEQTVVSAERLIK